jgi:prefoldin subunit 5
MSRINKEQEHEISTMKQKISSCNQENQALKD